MRKTKTFFSACMIACIVAWLGFLHGWRSLTSSLHERKLVLLPQRDMAVDIWIEVTCQRDSTWNLFATTWQLSKLGTLLRRSWRNLLSWNVGWCTAEVQLRDPCTQYLNCEKRSGGTLEARRRRRRDERRRREGADTNAEGVRIDAP